MSTKAIEALIEKAEERAFRETAGTSMAKAARQELEAIRKAATVLDSRCIRDTWHGEAFFASGNDLADLDAAADVLAAIAKEAS